jgi:mannose-6-phosphate isomerase-like protein (cupin superfamily)
MHIFDPIAVANGLEPFDFHEFGPFNNASFAVFRGTGVDASNWELHCDTDELLFVLEGSVKVEILTDGDRRIVPLVAGQFTVVPKGCWHRHIDIVDLVEMHYTPGTSEESTELDPRKAGG